MGHSPPPKAAPAKAPEKPDPTGGRDKDRVLTKDRESMGKAFLGRPMVSGLPQTPPARASTAASMVAASGVPAAGGDGAPGDEHKSGGLVKPGSFYKATGKAMENGFMPGLMGTDSVVPLNLGQKEKLRRVSEDLDFANLTKVVPKLATLREELIKEGIDVNNTALSKMLVDLRVKEMNYKLQVLQDRRRAIHVLIDHLKRYDGELKEAAKMAKEKGSARAFKYELPKEIDLGMPALNLGEADFSEEDIKATRGNVGDAVRKADMAELKTEGLITEMQEKLKVAKDNIKQAIPQLALAITPQPKKLAHKAQPAPAPAPAAQAKSSLPSGWVHTSKPEGG